MLLSYEWELKTLPPSVIWDAEARIRQGEVPNPEPARGPVRPGEDLPYRPSRPFAPQAATSHSGGNSEPKPEGPLAELEENPPDIQLYTTGGGDPAFDPVGSRRIPDYKAMSPGKKAFLGSDMNFYEKRPS
ncbi:MAG: hypothetical protein NkDv07_0755 [Candidatus Improbicoccus devescovinae]|nr:MAG: hypothetical protein NkDv07_0755 [Candidatus Improbicoccus devescovinae]